MAKKDNFDITEIAKKTREALFKASSSLSVQVEQIAEKISSELGDKKQTSSQSLVQLLTSQGIAVDKLFALLKNLRNMESEMGNDLEASFIIIEEYKDGSRRIVASALELPPMAESKK